MNTTGNEEQGLAGLPTGNQEQTRRRLGPLTQELTQELESATGPGQESAAAQQGQETAAAQQGQESAGTGDPEPDSGSGSGSNLYK